MNPGRPLALSRTARGRRSLPWQEPLLPQRLGAYRAFKAACRDITAACRSLLCRAFLCRDNDSAPHHAVHDYVCCSATSSSFHDYTQWPCRSSC